ncbi:1,4-dihydroxy-2-naphthoate octaprenyltransferase [Blattabacterium cuenoti]|uniref:1,4-dihydroxy-2-naphthoate octaprenyltransferase n=1 Tax=Blattabacterium cuenoti TaxID=1653831 RepID=UPI00163B8D55|nr:1,4-dihydroxy-2-naphthoate octaprenyltransferase [Blattabacterium cuenoti]
MKIKYFIYASRVYTLPLSITGITSSYLLSSSSVIELYKNIDIYTFSILTSISLQILSNFSNDYGDSIKTFNNVNSYSPKKLVKCGKISLYNMKKSIYIFSILSFFFGIILIFKTVRENIFIFFLYTLGLLFCIYSSISYSIGKTPYGWKFGLGDLSVFIFFGLFSVLGNFFLLTHIFPTIDIFLLSFGIGFLSVSVLNVNNIRDLKDDIENGKITIPVKLGVKYSKFYHTIIVFIPIVICLLFLYIRNVNNTYQWIFSVLIIISLMYNIKNIIFIKRKNLLNLELKKLVLLTFLYGLNIGITNFL